MLKVLVLFAIFMSGSAVSATQMIYDCKLKSHSQGKWTPVEASYLFDTSTQSIRAVDPYISYAKKKPIDTTVEEFGPPIYKFSYRLILASRQGDDVSVLYVVRFDAARNNVTIQAFMNNAGRERSTGSCALRTR